MAELQEIIDQIVVIQKAIKPPTGEKALALATDELPPDLAVFPVFLNVETETAITDSSGGLREQIHQIDMNLVMGTAEKKYSMRSRRLWVQKVLTAFAAKVTLNGTCTQAQITGMTFDTPLQWNDAPFMVAAFRLQTTVKEAVSFAA